MIKLTYYSKWLISLIILISVVVLVGGLTRLTGSGLSMVDWRPIFGFLPPLSLDDWMYIFDQYKQFPEYKYKNFNMTLTEFKVIFYWEYIHRVLGRIIGLTGLIPLLYLYLKKTLTTSELRNGIIINIWIILQGIVGWYMVKSGLVENPNVSHFRLALHLSLAFGLYAFIWYQLSEFINHKIILKGGRLIKKIIYGFTLILIIQLVYGAFVAGLKAGYLYPNFPKMGTHWISPEAFSLTPMWKNLINNSFMIQFIHRSIAWILFFYTFVTYFIINKYGNQYLKRVWQFMIGLISLQFILGISTLISKMNIYIASWHQINALLIIALLSMTINRINNNQQ